MSQKTEQKGQSFLKGTAILTAATFIVKFINIFFSIPLANFLDDEGMGHFNTAYDIFVFFSVLASSGTPVAISRLVSVAYAQNRKREADKIFRVAFTLFSGIGLVRLHRHGGVFPSFAMLMNQNDRSMYAIAALAPMCFFMSVSSCLRGYFQGRSNMTPTAVSQVLESLIKLFVGSIALALYFLKTTGLPELGAAGAILGVSIGSFFAVLYILLYYFRKSRDTRYSPFEPKVSSVGEILKSILTFAVPVIIGSAFLSALDIVDSSVMMYRLQGAAGVDANSAIAMKGWLGTARKYFDPPNAVIVPISTIVLPMLSGAIARRKARNQPYFHALPAHDAHGSHPVCRGFVYFCKAHLRPVALQPPGVCGKYRAAARRYGAGGHHGELALHYELDDSGGRQGIRAGHQYDRRYGGTHRRCVSCCGIPEINAMGSAVGTFVSYLVMIVLNLIALHRMLPEIPSVVRMGIRPLLASVIMGAVSYPVYLLLTRFMSEKFAVIRLFCLQSSFTSWRRCLPKPSRARRSCSCRRVKNWRINCI